MMLCDIKVISNIPDSVIPDAKVFLSQGGGFFITYLIVIIILRVANMMSPQSRMFVGLVFVPHPHT
jgi:hypothetical protein